MRPPVAVLIGAAAALVLHVTVGWWLSPAGAVLAGVLSRRAPGLSGMAGLVLSWGALMAWSVLADPRAAAEMTRVLAGILGGLPEWTVSALPFLAAAALGLGGGLLGGALRNNPHRVRR